MLAWQVIRRKPQDAFLPLGSPTEVSRSTNPPLVNHFLDFAQKK